MKMLFPNPSRDYDESHDRVLFWGYDGAIEVSFYVEAAALKKIFPKKSQSEFECLKAFDSTRKRIYAVADKVYRRGGGGKGTYAYVLGVEDF